MALYTYGPAWLWLYIVTTLYSYGPLQSWPLEIWHQRLGNELIEITFYGPVQRTQSRRYRAGVVPVVSWGIMVLVGVPVEAIDHQNPALGLH